MLSTGEARIAWAPSCPDTIVRFYFWSGASAGVRAGTEHAWAALDQVLHAHDYAPRKADTGGYNCRRITGGTGYSLHAYGIAVDINWSTNPYGPVLHTDMPRNMVDDILSIKTFSGAQVFRWGGDYSGNKDAMHFEIVCTPADIASGIVTTAAPPEVPPFKGPPDRVRPDHPDWSDYMNRDELIDACKQAMVEVLRSEGATGANIVGQVNEHTSEEARNVLSGVKLLTAEKQ